MPSFLTLLRITGSATFMGRGLIYLFGDAPFRALFWHQDLMAGPVRAFLGLDWQEYAAASDPWIHFAIKINGLVFILCGLLCVTVGRKAKWQQAILGLGVLLLGFFLLTRTMGDFGRVGMLIEHAAQLTAPIWLLWYLRSGQLTPSLTLGIKIAIALTFIGHGLYAWGYYPVPASYLTMMAWVPGIDIQIARPLLQVAAILDFLVAIVIFLPKPTSLPQIALAWAAIWGFLTALARTVTHYTPVEDYYGLIPWTFETLVRTSHWLLPLALLFVLRSLTGRSVTRVGSLHDDASSSGQDVHESGAKLGAQKGSFHYLCG